MKSWIIFISIIGSISLLLYKLVGEEPSVFIGSFLFISYFVLDLPWRKHNNYKDNPRGFTIVMASFSLGCFYQIIFGDGTLLEGQMPDWIPNEKVPLFIFGLLWAWLSYDLAKNRCDWSKF